MTTSSMENRCMIRDYVLSLTTQGPLYPPSEVMNGNGDFVVIGQINRSDSNGGVSTGWGCGIVSADLETPRFGERAPYAIIEEFQLPLTPRLRDMELYTLPLPLPCNNYPMTFAPSQCPEAATESRPSFPFHATPIPDLEACHGRKRTAPVTLGEWVAARGFLRISSMPERKAAEFAFEFSGLIPDSVYTIMALRARDLHPERPTRPGPLGAPNVFVADGEGRARYRAVMPDPFPDPGDPAGNRIVNVVVLWMSYQMNYGGAIGYYGLGGDIHAQLKLQAPSFQEFRT